MSPEADRGSLQVVVVRVGSEEYGIPILGVESIIRYDSPTPVPQARAGIEGVLNLRGRVVPMVDLARVLLGRPLDVSGKARIVVCDTAGGSIGLAVDDAHEVVRLDAADVQLSPEALAADGPSQAITGIAQLGERLVILLDPEHILPGFAGAAGSDDEESDSHA